MQAKRGGYRGIPKPKLPPHLKRVHVNARIQQWMLDKLKEEGEVGFVLEKILMDAGFEYCGSNSNEVEEQ
jgi:predicted small metal-binding protein